jgi:polysaccharide export outer membrane protein
MNNTIRVLLMVFLALMLGACATSVKNPSTLNNIKSAWTSVDDEYFIQVGDVVQIRFFGDESSGINPANLSETLKVRPDGKVHLHFLNEAVMVAGFKPDIVEHNLKIKFSKYLKDPLVTINITEFSPREVYVGGEVEDPQAIPYRKDLTVLSAIINAGWFTYEADNEVVILIRYRGYNTKPLIISLDMEKVIENENPLLNLPLMPCDMIIPSMSGISKMNKWVELYLRRNFPISPSELRSND